MNAILTCIRENVNYQTHLVGTKVYRPYNEKYPQHMLRFFIQHGSISSVSYYTDLNTYIRTNRVIQGWLLTPDKLSQWRLLEAKVTLEMKIYILYLVAQLSQA